jgi:hypothetical protein
MDSRRHLQRCFAARQAKLIRIRIRNSLRFTEIPEKPACGASGGIFMTNAFVQRYNRPTKK